jgi:hypothetical protein
MQSRTKFHVMAIATICATILLVFHFKKPIEAQPAAAPTVATSARFVIIYSATWGMNCAQQVTRELTLQKAQATSQQKPSTPKPAPEAPRENNALITLTNLCNNKETCAFTPTSAMLGSLNIHCFKQLEIAYRCFEYDKIRYVSGKEDKAITINCSHANAS